MLAADHLTVDTNLDNVDGTTTSVSALLSSPGADGLISLREAIEATNNTSGANEIDFATGLGPFTLGSGQLAITDDLTITGLGIDETIIDGNDSSRVFSITPGVTATFRDLTVSGGSTTGSGAGIYNDGDSITLERVVVSENHASVNGGGLYSLAGSSVVIVDTTFDGNTAKFGGGGRINTDGSTTISISGSTFSNNTADDGNGVGSAGGLYVWGGASAPTTEIINSTFSGNYAAEFTGGLRGQNGGTILVVNSTITNNTAGVQGGGIAGHGNPNVSTFLVHNSILADNHDGNDTTSWDDAVGSVHADSSYNLVGLTTSSALLDQTIDFNKVIETADPMLGPLADNGGVTRTHALETGSEAIDRGNDLELLSGMTTDQRGYDRNVDIDFDGPSGGTVDIGAFEYRKPIVVSTATDVSDSDYSAGNLSLREALALAAASIGPDTIQFDSSVTDIQLSGTHLTIDSDVTITGPGSDQLAIDGNNTSRVFYVSTGVNASLSGMKITGGNASGDGAAGMGGGVYHDGEMLTLDRVNVYHNRSDFKGGGLYSNTGSSVESVNSTFDDNESKHGGGAFLNVAGSSSISIAGSTFSNNKADVGNDAGTGGGLYIWGGSNTPVAEITNSTFSGNHAELATGGLRAQNGGAILVVNCTITDNTSGSTAGGISAWGATPSVIEIHNSIIVDNRDDHASAIDDVEGHIHANSSHNLVGKTNVTQLADQAGVLIEDVKLAPLGPYGGPTQTHALLEGSMAEDSGDDTLIPTGITTDQRGTTELLVDRIVGTSVDIGAFEYGADPLGTGKPFQIYSDSAGGNQDNSWVATNDSGQSVVAWQGDGPAGIGIYAQILNQLDNSTTTPQLLSTVSGGTLGSPRIGIDGAGNYAVVWNEDVGSGTEDYHVFLRRVGSDGTLIDATPLDLGDVSGTPSIAVNANGRVVATWINDVGDLVYRRFTMSGSSLDAVPVVVANAAAGLIVAPASGRLASIGEDDSFTLHWGQEDGNGIIHLHVQKFFVDGTTDGLQQDITSESDIPVRLPDLAQYFPWPLTSVYQRSSSLSDVVVDDEGGIVVSWIDQQLWNIDYPSALLSVLGEYRLMLQRFHPDTGWENMIEVVDGDFMYIVTSGVNPVSNHSFILPANHRLAVDNLGRIGVAWEERTFNSSTGGPSTDTRDINVQWFESDGTPLIEEPIVADRFGVSSDFATKPSLSVDGTGGFLLTGTVEEDIYARRYALDHAPFLDSAGTLIVKDVYSDLDEITISSRNVNGLQVIVFNDLVSTIPTSSVKAIQIEAGTRDNRIDLSTIDSTTFPNLTSGNISVHGGLGNDTILGTQFGDLLAGGAGDDTYVFSGSSSLGQDSIQEFTNEGIDTLDFSNFDVTGGIDLDLNSSALSMGHDVAGTNGDLLKLTAPTGGHYFEAVIGTNYDDTIVGNELANRLEGLWGYNTLVGGEGDDSYVYSDEYTHIFDTIVESSIGGHDTIDFSGRNSEITFDLRELEYVEGLIGTSFDDFLIGTSNNDVISAGEGKDILVGLSGADHLDGGEGDDSYIFGGNDNPADDTLVEPQSGGVDALDFSHLDTGVNFTLPMNFEIAFGSDYDDILIGNDASNVLEGGNGTDLLSGGRGDDLYRFGGTDNPFLDTILELPGEGLDSYDFSERDSSINFSLTQGSNVEGVIGSAHNDVLTGTADDNYLEGGGGADQLTGGGGDDVYVYRNTDDPTLDIVFENVGEGSDLIDFSGLTSGIDFDLNSSPNVENVIGSVFDDILTGNTSANNLAGGLGNDIYKFLGTEDPTLDVVSENIDAGSDTLDFSGLSFGATVDLRTIANVEGIIGSAHDDDLTGNELANYINGGAGDDRIEGREGIDTLVGGPGTDTYTIIAGESADTDDIFEKEPSDIEHPGGVVNTTPFIQLSGNTNAEGQYATLPNTMLVLATVTDTDTPIANVTILVDGLAPEDISVSPTGQITWTPDLAEEGNTYFVTVQVTDDTNLTHSETLSAHVETGLDSDADGLSDIREAILGTNPNRSDSDGDYLNDNFEIGAGLDPLNDDQNDNGIRDDREDFDQDGLDNKEESDWNTDPNQFDTDEDGVSDGAEVDLGTDPNDPENTNDLPIASRIEVEVYLADESLFWERPGHPTDGPQEGGHTWQITIGEHTVTGGPNDEWTDLNGNDRIDSGELEDKSAVSFLFLNTDKDYKITVSHLGGTGNAHLTASLAPTYDRIIPFFHSGSWPRSFTSKQILLGEGNRFIDPSYVDGKELYLYGLPDGDLRLEGVSNEDEDTKGGFVDLNIDDDDGDGVFDKNDTNGVVGENDLLELTVPALKSYEEIPYQLQYGDDLRIWRNPDKTGLVTSSTEFGSTDLGRDGETLYVEALNEGEFTISLVYPDFSSWYLIPNYSEVIDTVKVVSAASILVAIDGTSSHAWSTDPDFLIRDPSTNQIVRSQSHVLEFYQDYVTLPELKYYTHGPNNWAAGVHTEMVAKRSLVLNWIGNALAENPNRPIDIVGHSRGGCLAVEIARYYDEHGFLVPGTYDQFEDVSIRFLGLYDPVDMTHSFGEDTIPPNVEHVAVVYAAGTSEEVGKQNTNWEFLPWIPFYEFIEKRSRDVFNRVDSGPESENTQYNVEWIFGTHAAIGGAPWAGDSPPGHSDMNDRAKAIESDRFIRDMAQSVSLPINDEDNYGYDLFGAPRPDPDP